jgi:hypothetical protein
MKCDICGTKVETTFLKKPLGTFIKDEKGKKHIVCKNCQASLKTKEQIIEKL